MASAVASLSSPMAMGVKWSMVCVCVCVCVHARSRGVRGLISSGLLYLSMEIKQLKKEG